MSHAFVKKRCIMLLVRNPQNTYVITLRAVKVVSVRRPNRAWLGAQIRMETFWASERPNKLRKSAHSSEPFLKKQLLKCSWAWGFFSTESAFYAAEKMWICLWIFWQKWQKSAHYKSLKNQKLKKIWLVIFSYRYDAQKEGATPSALVWLIVINVVLVVFEQQWECMAHRHKLYQAWHTCIHVHAEQPLKHV